MKRNVSPVIVTTFALLTIPIGPLTAEEHTVEVKLKTDDIGCRVVSPKCDEKINDARRGDVVRFNFKNECPRAVSMRIGRFQPAYLGDSDAGTPLEPACLQLVSLKSGGSRVIQCRVKKTAVVNRTYKYSILSGKLMLLDPQIEIVP